MNPVEKRVWVGWTVAGCLLIYAMACCFVPVFSFNRWDNFNYFTPLLTHTHGQWLQGHFPSWNEHQHLGEPLHGFGMSGALYVPYTLALILLRWLQFEPDRLVDVIFFIHVPGAAWGWYRLLRRMGVPCALACGSSWAMCTAGGIQLLSMAWIFVFAYFAWMPWLWVWASERLEKGTSSSSVLLAVGFALTAAIGHPQFFCYVWVWVGLWILLEIAGGMYPLWMLKRLVRPLAGGLLLSLPFWLPFLETYVSSMRAQGLTLQYFLVRSLDVSALQGLLWPLFKVPNQFFHHAGSLALFQGFWVLPAILAGFWALRRSSLTPPVKRFLIACSIALLFLIFALGENTPFYAWTHAIPLWGSFRWPFRFLLIVLPSLGIASALGLALLMKGKLRRGWGPLFLTLAGTSSIATVVMCQKAGVMTYSETYADWGAKKLGIDARYRILPLGTPRSGLAQGRPVMQPMALLASATANGYRSATGSTGAMTSQRYLRLLPSHDLGFLFPTAYPALLSSHLLRTWNIRYVAVNPEDSWALGLIRANPDYHLVKDLGVSQIYENTDALPAAYFAGHRYRMEPSAFNKGLLLNQAPLDAVYLDAPTSTGPIPRGTLLGSQANEGGRQFDIETSSGGFFVLSETYYPQWHAWVDGQDVPVQLVNGLVMGVDIPAGARRLVWRYRSEGLRAGLWLAGIGLIVLLIPLPRRVRRHQDLRDISKIV